MQPQHTIQAVCAAIVAGTFVKGTLSKPIGGTDAPVNLYLKPVQIKDKSAVSITFRYKTRDEVKNMEPGALNALLTDQLENGFREAVFFTTTQVFTLRANRKGEYRLFSEDIAMPTAKAVSATNDREKQRLIDPAAQWLRHLDITTNEGKIRSDAQDKWRQMNKYLEVIAALLDSTPLRSGARIVDMGAGKGYLTFALADYLTQRYAHHVEVLGVELRQPLVDFCNRTAQACGMSNLKFVARDIAEVQQERMDMLIALHACDTATDLALFAGMQAKADLVVVAPCCHKQVRRDLEGTAAVQSILQHGIMKERQAELLTDTIRALLMQSVGYKTKVFEFVGVEHTPKNVMITAELRSTKPEVTTHALSEVQVLKATFGLKKHFLEELMQQGAAKT